MQPPAHIDMSVIREALARRAQGGGMPATQQVSMPQGGSPLQTPNPAQPTGPLTQPAMPAQAAPQAAQSAGQPQRQQSAGPAFDDETKAVSKALIARLLKVI